MLITHTPAPHTTHYVARSRPATPRRWYHHVAQDSDWDTAPPGQGLCIAVNWWYEVGPSDCEGEYSRSKDLKAD